MRTQLHITSWQGTSKAHICPDLGRCRGHSGPASGCPTRTTEGNARLKRVCSGPRFSNDEIELHGVAPGIRHSGGDGTQCEEICRVGLRWAGRRPVALANARPLPNVYTTTSGRTFVYVDTHDTHARPRWTPRWDTGRVGEVARLIGKVSLTGHSLGDSLTPTTTPHEDKQGTKPRAKCLAGLGKAFLDVAGCVGVVLWAAGHQHGAMSPSPSSAEAGIDDFEGRSGSMAQPTWMTISHLFVSKNGTCELSPV